MPEKLSSPDDRVQQLPSISRHRLPGVDKETAKNENPCFVIVNLPTNKRESPVTTLVSPQTIAFNTRGRPRDLKLKKDLLRLS
jgi:hypothetical protein